MTTKWKIYCEESGDKAIPWRSGSSHFYVITAVMIKEEDEELFIEKIDELKRKVLGMRDPLEWKKLRAGVKRDDVKLAKFLKRLEAESPTFYVTNVYCNKHETIGLGLQDTQTFMNYLYGLMFKRISHFLRYTDSSAKLIIDRNTDSIAQGSLQEYLKYIALYNTGKPRFSKPKWINPEDNSILGLSDFISGISLRSLNDYQTVVNVSCKSCKKINCMYTCNKSNFSYKKSFFYPVQWNFNNIGKWSWRGLIYHPCSNKDNYRHLFLPR